MKVLKDACEDCGGNLVHLNRRLICLTCSVSRSTEGWNARQLATLNSKLEEIGDAFLSQLTPAGKYLLTKYGRNGLVSDVVRIIHLLKNLEDNLEISDEDRMFLKDSGFLEEVRR